MTSTGFLYNGVDICNNYQPLGDSVMNYDSSTNFMANGQDLNTIFMAYQNGTMYDVSYSINDISLGSIFQHEVYSNDIIYTQTGGTYSTGDISGTFYNDIITFTSTGYFEITHNNNNQPINFLLVGRGGDGSQSSWGTTGNYYYSYRGTKEGYGGNGGGGGEVIIDSCNCTVGTYKIRFMTDFPFPTRFDQTNSSGYAIDNLGYAKGGYDGVSTQGEQYNGESGSGNSQGSSSDFFWTGGGAPSLVPGLGGGGDSGDGQYGYFPGAGTVFNENTYGSGGFGGGNSWDDGANGTSYSGAGGNGGGYKNKSANTGGYNGGSGGSGICILYFNPRLEDSE